MRTPRIKIDPESGESVYHCMSRAVAGEFLFDDVDKELFRKQLWKVVDYCGVRIVTYDMLSNHFHLEVRIPKKEPISDEELLRRYQVLHSQPNRYESARLEVIKKRLAENGPEAEAWRESQLRMMGDVSPFLQLLKQRFSIWYNKAHKRFGTVWAERFKSVLMEPLGDASRVVAAYIDLNCVRAGLVKDPKDYRFCGYAEAVAGNQMLREELTRVMGAKDWDEAQAAYRMLLFGTGAKPKMEGASISQEAMAKVMAEEGKLSLPEVLRSRLRHLTGGAVLGSRIFVETQIAAYRERTGLGQRTQPRPFTALPGFAELNTLRALRQRAFG